MYGNTLLTMPILPILFVCENPECICATHTIFWTSVHINMVQCIWLNNWVSSNDVIVPTTWKIEQLAPIGRVLDWHSCFWCLKLYGLNSWKFNELFLISSRDLPWCTEAEQVPVDRQLNVNKYFAVYTKVAQPNIISILNCPPQILIWTFLFWFNLIWLNVKTQI